MFQLAKKQTILVGAVLSGFVFLVVFANLCSGMSSMNHAVHGSPMGKAYLPLLSCMDMQKNICTMSIAKYINQWEPTLLGAFRASASLLPAFAILFAFYSIFVQRNRREMAWRHHLRLRRWLFALIRPYDSILRAFARGLLHSQTYA